MIGGRSTVAAVGLSDQTWHLNLACSAFTLASPQHRRHRAVIIIGDGVLVDGVGLGFGASGRTNVSWSKCRQRKLEVPLSSLEAIAVLTCPGLPLSVLLCYHYYHTRCGLRRGVRCDMRSGRTTSLSRCSDLGVPPHLSWGCQFPCPPMLRWEDLSFIFMVISIITRGAHRMSSQEARSPGTM